MRHADFGARQCHDIAHAALQYQMKRSREITNWLICREDYG